MKKILTLLVMFLATWSILGAQTPVFGYQAVVRTADNELVENTPVLATITVLNGQTEVYSETHTNISTDGLGMLSLLVGTGTEKVGNITDVDWSNAVIRTDFEIDGEELVSVETEVLAAPFALQALETVLTTDRIVQYVLSSETSIDDYEEIMEALNNNVPEQGQMWQLTRERIINYIMNHRDIALQVSVAYLENATEDDFEEIYGYFQSDAVAEAIEIIAETAINNRTFVVEVLTGYLENATPAEVDEVVDAILEHEDDLLPYVVQFITDNRTRFLNLLSAFLGSASSDEVERALVEFNQSDMKAKLVDELFYNYLDSYIQPTGNMTDSQIRNRVNDRLGDEYLEKTQCDDEDVDICNMRDQVEEMIEH